MTRTTTGLTFEGTELHVWLLPPPRSARELPAGELDARERKRAAAFRRTDDRMMYAAAHVGLRRVLAAYTGIAPGRLPIGPEVCHECAISHGRPVLLGVPGAPYFSLSHSHGLVLVAVSTTRVGADVQRVPSPETVELCLPALHPAERREIDRLPPDQSTVAFGRLWSRKEAYLKGLGTGLTRRADTDYLGEYATAERPPGWLVANLPLCPSHISAVALAGEEDCPVSIRPVPAEWLYAHDATDRIAGAQPGLRTVLRAHTPRPHKGHRTETERELGAS
ncbi:4'-phosphopantetheinyl transferase family protein [Streptomyces sp. NPDC002889]|uniref:4'-phosphopantetheinyl transferase family protein n=1 Tax=Streptomyces sp. NPDC002889 TaxID=3364669 RepID=UPI00367DDA04